jgi:low affinity Fe/Cu permease
MGGHRPTVPLFHYSDTWQRVINTGTTVLTLLAVFLIQNSQNRDGAVIQAKLHQTLRAGGNAQSGSVGLEHLTDVEIAWVKKALEREVHQVTMGEAGHAAPTVEELLEQSRDTVFEATKEAAPVARNSAL